MARQRMIKPEFWTSEQVVECTFPARLLFIGLWNFCDDGGRHPASIKRIKMEVFPADDLTIADVSALVQELIAQGLVSTYIVNGDAFWEVTGWHHQYIKKPRYQHPDATGTVPAAGEYPTSTPPVPHKTTKNGNERKRTETNGTELKRIESVRTLAPSAEFLQGVKDQAKQVRDTLWPHANRCPDARDKPLLLKACWMSLDGTLPESWLWESVDIAKGGEKPGALFSSMLVEKAEDLGADFRSLAAQIQLPEIES